MATQLEERLRRYGETFERALVADVRREPSALRPVPFYRRRFVVALGAAATVILIAAAVALFARTGDEPPTPVSPPEPSPLLPSLGIGSVWPGPEVTDVDRSTGNAVADAFTRDVLGEIPAAVSTMTTMSVEVSLTNGTALSIVAFPGSDGFAVQQVGDGFHGFEPQSGHVLFESVPSASDVEVLWRDGAGVHREHFLAADTRGGAAPIQVTEPLYTVVVVARDALGGVLDVSGVPFVAPDLDEPQPPVGPDDGVLEPHEFTVIVLNAGQPAGAAENVTNQLRGEGYNMLVPNVGAARDRTAVQCRPGFESAAEDLARALGGDAVVEPFAEPPPEAGRGAVDANCVVYLGRV